MKIIQQAKPEQYSIIDELRKNLHNELKIYGEHHEYVSISLEDFVLSTSPRYILSKRDEGYEFFVIFSEDTIVGYYYITKYAGYITLQELYVLPEYRGNRYGSTVIEMLKMYAKNIQNINEIFLAVDETNEVAYNIYKLGGFEKVYFDTERKLICMQIKL